MIDLCNSSANCRFDIISLLIASPELLEADFFACIAADFLSKPQKQVHVDIDILDF